jgi:hypothetical protein
MLEKACVEGEKEREGGRVRERGRDLMVRVTQILRGTLTGDGTRVMDRRIDQGSAHYSAVWLQVKSEY